MDYPCHSSPALNRAKLIFPAPHARIPDISSLLLSQSDFLLHSGHFLYAEFKLVSSKRICQRLTSESTPEPLSGMDWL